MPSLLKLEIPINKLPWDSTLPDKGPLFFKTFCRVTSTVTLTRKEAGRREGKRLKERGSKKGKDCQEEGSRGFSGLQGNKRELIKGREEKGQENKGKGQKQQKNDTAATLLGSVT